MIFIGTLMVAVKRRLRACRKGLLSKKIDYSTFTHLAVHGSTLLPSKLILRSSYLVLYRIGEAGTWFAWETFFMLFVVGPDSACLRMDVPSLADWLIVRRRELIFDITLSRRCCSRTDYTTVPHVFWSSNENRLPERRFTPRLACPRMIFTFAAGENFPPSSRAFRVRPALS